MQRQEYSQRVRSTHLIKENVSLSWVCVPTLTIQDLILFQGFLTTEETQIWATPQARDYKGPQGRAYKGQALDLPAQIQLTLLQEEQTNTPGSRSAPSTQSNPRWIETLMGLPVGWTMPSCVNPWTIELMKSDSLETE